MPTQRLIDDLRYIGAVNEAMLKAGCESPNADGWGLLTPAEQQGRDIAQAAGVSAADFVAEVLAQRANAEKAALAKQLPSVADIRATLRAKFGSEGEVFGRSLEASPKGRRALNLSHEGDAA